MNISNNGTGNDKTNKFTMDRHIYHILVLTGINACTPKDTPSIKTLLGPDIYFAPRKDTDKGIYADEVGILQNVSRNAWPDIELTINQVFCHTRKPKFYMRSKLRTSDNNSKAPDTRDSYSRLLMKSTWVFMYMPTSQACCIFIILNNTPISSYVLYISSP